MKFLRSAVVSVFVLSFASICCAADVEWTAEANMDHQLFPSLIIATASVRPIEDEDAEAKEPHQYLLGQPFGLVGILIPAKPAKQKVKVTLKENELMSTSTWEGELAEAGHAYFIAPKVTYKFDKLRAATQQMPMNISFAVMIDGEEAGEKSETLQVRSINDCPFG